MSSEKSVFGLININLKLRQHEFLFVTLMWLFSRLVLIIGMQFIAPSLHLNPIGFDEPGLDTLQVKNFTPHAGWELFTHWDGEHYRNIVTKGYTYITSNEQNNIAFFPIYPLIVRLFVSMGIHFDIAGTILSNVAFLGTLLIFYRWTNQLYNQSVARWTTAVMAWFPLSLFCSLAYTESFFLLFTITTLYTFQNQRYLWAALFGMFATASRPPGLVLIPSLLIVAWIERRPLSAYLSALAMSGGLMAFGLFCWLRFHEPLAFFRAQSGWPQPSWFELSRDIIMPVFNSNVPVYVYMAAIALITVIGLLIFYDPGWGYLAVGVLVVPLLAYFPALLQIMMPIIAIWLMWHFRRELHRILFVYGSCALGFLFLSGTKMSIHRHIYAIAPLSLLLGLLLSRHPRSGYIVMGSFGLILLFYSIRFAWWDWIG